MILTIFLIAAAIAIWTFRAQIFVRAPVAAPPAAAPRSSQAAPPPMERAPPRVLTNPDR